MRNIIIGSAISGSVFYLYKLAIIKRSLSTIFKNIRVFKFSARQIELEIDLILRNTSSKTLEIDSILGDLYIDNVNAGMLTLKTPLLIKPLELRYRIKLPFFSLRNKVEVPSQNVANLKLI